MLNVCSYIIITYLVFLMADGSIKWGKKVFVWSVIIYNRTIIQVY